MMRAGITPRQRAALLEDGWLDDEAAERLKQSHARLLAALITARTHMHSPLCVCADCESAARAIKDAPG